MYDKQMELFEDGGLRDEGGMVDEESGNEVPVGSTRKEVRDDIPAMLSEGEFVFPADVVRFIGLEKLMKIRQNAKQGLKQMEEMGQMGNSDEATMPDDLPFGMMDLIIVEGEEEEPEEKAHGGVVHMQKGGFTVPKFDPRNQDVRQYENAEGKKLNIPFLGGKPVYPIPEGYFPVGTVVEEEKDETKEAIPTDDDDPRPPVEPSEFQKAGGWNMDFGDPPDANKVELWIKEAEKVSTVGNVVSAVLTAVNPVLGVFTAVGNHLNKKGITNNYKRALEAASKTPIKGQMDRIEKVNTRLTDPESKGILGGVVGEIIDGLSGAVGLTPEETIVAKNVSNKSIQTPIETDSEEFKLALDESLRPVARPTIEETDEGTRFAYPDESLRPRARSTPIPKPFEDQPPLSDKTPPSLTEITDFARTTPSVEEQTQEALLPSDRTGIDTFRDFIPTDTAAFATKPEQVTGGLGEVKTRADDRQDFKLITANEELQNALQTIRSADATNLLMQKNVDAKNKAEELLNQLTSNVASLVGRNEGRSDEPEAGPSNVPTAYEAGQQRRKPKEKTPTTSTSNKDDGPSLAERMQKERQQRQEQGKKAAEDVKKYKESDVGKKAISTKSGREAIQRTENVVADLERGIKRGFKKGGLASRKK